MASGQPAAPASEWRPTTTTAIVWLVLMIPLTFAGLMLFGAAVAVARGGSFTVQGGFLELVLLFLLVIGLMLAHEAVHGLAMYAFGARPTFGAGASGQFLVYLYATSDGHVFTRRQYLTVALAPAVAISAIGLGLCLAPLGPWLVFPLALHLSGCIGDFAVSLVVLRQPAGTQFQDLKDAVRFVPSNGLTAS